MSRSDANDGHDHTKLLLQPYLLRMQHLRQPLADGAKSKKSKTKLFHVCPFARMVSHHQTPEGTRLLACRLLGELLLSCHNRGRSTSHPPDRYQVDGSFFISEPAKEPRYGSSTGSLLRQ